ncbi:GNAT family N-acetyltransferase [Streptomyces sp. NPDC050617]|uniref:GNAT family N-acetyltransferase n=1 Tax=Streptomyces sp. NPDC050617 TaxID=3154628 RepID=UPI0034161AA9
MSPEVQVRTIAESDVPDWCRAMHVGFLRRPTVSKEEVEVRLAGIDLARTQGAFAAGPDGAGRCVATFRSFAQQLTVVGGAAVPADAISNVTVSPTHRRRGLLSRMMDADLRLAKERGDAVATLISAEYPIYGRYGFGPATWITEWEIDVARTALDRRYAGPADGGRVDFATPEAVRELGPAFHERLRAVRPGLIDRSERWWRLETGALSPTSSDEPWKEPFYAVYRGPDGTVDGLLSYQVEEGWDGKLPDNTAAVRSLLAASPAAERALWHFVLSVDWISKVRSGHRAPDDVLPLLLGDPRAARVITHADYLWLRPLDVPRLLEARTYGTTAALVLDVRDPAGLASGRYLLDAAPDGATCAPTTRSPDLTLDVGELGTLYLGDESAVRLAALGRVREEREGAAATADALLRTSRRPWCPDVF